MAWDSSQPDRRTGLDRRGYQRGGRRKTDWPSDVGALSCPSCLSKEIKFIDATPNTYFWQCHRCRHTWDTERADVAK